MSKFKKLFPDYPHVERDATLALLKQAAEVIPELEYNKEDQCLDFPLTSTFELKIHGDTDTSLNPVFRGELTTYCPKEVQCTKYYDNVACALKALAKLYRKQMTPISGGIRKRKGN
jgi:hypothetical protein